MKSIRIHSNSPSVTLSSKYSPYQLQNYKDGHDAKLVAKNKMQTQMFLSWIHTGDFAIRKCLAQWTTGTGKEFF